MRAVGGHIKQSDGTGIGARHQTGWTGLVAKLIQQQGERRARLASLDRVH